MHSVLHMCCELQSMALDPRYGSRKTREFMTGGLAGQVALNSRVSTPQLCEYMHSSKDFVNTRVKQTSVAT